MNVLKIELVREIHNCFTYKVTYEEKETWEVSLAGNTCNYVYEEIENIPESVLDFTEKWIKGEL